MIKAAQTSAILLVGGALLLTDARMARGAEDKSIPDIKRVQAVGRSENKSDLGAYEEALKDAFRNAVEQAAGVYVESRTDAEGDEVLSDKILTKAKGYIHKWSEVSKGRAGDGIYVVRIAADVSQRSLIKDIEMLLEQKGRPKIMLIVVEDIDGKRSSEGTAWSLIEDFFTEKGYPMVSAEHFKRLQNRNKVEAEMESNPTVAASYARKFGAEVLVYIRAKAKFAGKRELLDDMYSYFYTSTVTAQAVRATNADVLFTKRSRTNFKGHRALGAPSRAEAATKVLERTAESIKHQMHISLLSRWGKEVARGQRIALVIQGVTFRTRTKLKRALKKMTGVTSVNARDFSRGVATFDVQTRLSAEQLAEKLMEIEGVELDVSKFEEGAIHLKTVQ